MILSVRWLSIPSIMLQPLRVGDPQLYIRRLFTNCICKSFDVQYKAG